MEEGSIEENSLKVEISTESFSNDKLFFLHQVKFDKNLNSSAEKGSTEENSLTGEIYTERFSKDKLLFLHQVKIDKYFNSPAQKGSIEENNLTEEVPNEESTSKEESRIEDLNLEELDLTEKRKNYWFKQHGLVFRHKNGYEKERQQIVQIVIFGNEDCGKKELIGSVFEDHESFTVADRITRIEYRVFLPGACHIWMYDVKETEFVSKANFLKKTVFLFCHDVDNPKSFANLEETWIPTILEKSMKEMYYFLVSIKCKPKTQPKAKKLKKEDKMMDIKLKAKELNDRFCAGRIIECSIEDKHSLLYIFQSAIDYVYPRFRFI